VIHRIKLVVIYSLAISGLIAWLLFALRIINSAERIIVYDCRIAEISPDFPPQVREDCRKLILENSIKRSNITRT
jgi:hypothetical protein